MYPAIDIPPLLRLPLVGGDAAVGGGGGAQDRVPFRLPRPGEVLAVDEETEAPEPALGQQANDDVRFAVRAEGIRLQALRAGVVPLEADPPRALPLGDRDDAGRVDRKSTRLNSSH